MKIHMKENHRLIRLATIGICGLAALLSHVLQAADAASANTVAFTPSATTRYVWVDKLIIRAQPDSKSAEVARLSLGAEVTLQQDSASLVKRQETIFKLVSSETSKTPAINVTLDGNWQHVSAQGHDGWVFDGYLSRYPAPRSAKGAEGADADVAKLICGPAKTQKWKLGDSKKSPAYRIMHQHGKLEKDATEYEWEYDEFQNGCTDETVAQYDGGGDGSSDFKNLPLTFNEALLFYRRLFFAHDGNVSGTFEPGHRLEILPNDHDAEAIGFDDIIECAADKCSISQSHND